MTAPSRLASSVMLQDLAPQARHRSVELALFEFATIARSLLPLLAQLGSVVVSHSPLARRIGRAAIGHICCHRTEYRLLGT